MSRSTRFLQISVGFGATLALAALGVYPFKESSFLKPAERFVSPTALTPSQWREVARRHDFKFLSVFVFVTSGSTTTLPSNFNTANNTIHVIGAGAGGNPGTVATGGGGGGAGAYSNIVNAACAANSTQHIQVGTGDTWMRVDGNTGAPTTTAQGVLAKAGTSPTCGGAGGQASAGVGSTKNSGGNGGSPVHCTCGGSGGGGGGAAGSNGNGASGGSPATQTGGTGDAGHGGAGSTSFCVPGGNGTEFQACPAFGSGGGGFGGIGCGSGNGSNGGSYGAGGGGGSGGTAGAGFQGLIAIQYVPASGVTWGWFREFDTPRPPPVLPQSMRQFITAQGAPPIIPSHGWFSPLSEPVRAAPVLPPSLMRTTERAEPASPPPLLVTFIGWFRPLEIPVRPNPSMPASQQQAYAGGFPPIIPSHGWFQPLTEPVRPPPSLPPGQTVSIAPPPAVPSVPIPPSFGWFEPLAVPQTPLPRLYVGDFQALIWTPQTIIPVFTSMAWFLPLSEPVRAPPSLTPAQQQAFAAPPSQAAVPITPSFGWFRALSEPVRQPPSLAQAFQQALAAPPFPAQTFPMGWFRPLETPVRLPPNLDAVLRFVTANMPAQPPIVVFRTEALAAIEQGDTAAFEISIYNTAEEVVIGVSLAGTL